VRPKNGEFKIKTYTVHSPPKDNRSQEERAMDIVFIKEGYNLWAGLFGPFWSLANALWREAAVHIGLIILVSGILGMIGFNAQAISGAQFLGNLIFGLFARDVLRMNYERAGFKMVSVVTGKNFEECETRYFRKRNIRTQSKQSDEPATPPMTNQEAPAL